MHLQSIVLFAIGAAAHSGWTIPEGQSNGVYSDSQDADGTFVHTFLNPLSEDLVPRHLTMANSAKFTRGLNIARQVSISCPGYGLNRGDADAAYGNLTNVITTARLGQNSTT
jgi:hypothetical protein